MSLKIWLPLNGDLVNKGLYPTVITNNGMTYNDNGKIGKCGYFNGSSYVTGSMSYSGFTEWSVSLWFKVNSAPASWSILCNLGKRNGYANEYTNIVLNGSYLYVVVANGSSYKNNFGTTYTTGIWNHVVFTYKNRTLKLYLNGNLILTDTSTFDPGPNGSTLYSIGGAANNVEKVTGYINDVRIYDHCLSDSEIHELSLALVCHYKLDRIGQNGNNLVTGLTAGNHTTVTDNNTVTTAGTNSDTYFRINLSENIVVGQRYTLSCNASNVASGYKWRFPLGAQWNTSLPFFIDNGYNEYTFVANDISWDSNEIFMDDSNTSNNVRLTQAVFTDFRLYKADTIVDASGYEHTGSITGTITESTDTARYDGSLSLDGSSYISHPYALSELVAEQEWTCCAWVKPSAIASHTYLNNFNMGNRLNHGGRPILYLNSGANDYYMYGSTGYPILNEWQHFAFVFRNSDGYRKIYVNGVDISTSGPNNTSTPSGILKTIHIGEGLTGLIVDYREYATALTADDVKKIYNLGMKVDNGQNIHGFEFDETTDNLINRSSCTGGIILSDGTIQTHSSWYVTDYIPVTYGKNYLAVGLTTANSGNVYNAFYDSSKALTRTVLDTTDFEQEITPASGEAYVRLSIRNGSSEFATAGLYEVVNRKILQTGIIGSVLYNEETKAAIYKRGSIHAKEFIEI